MSARLAANASHDNVLVEVAYPKAAHLPTMKGALCFDAFLFHRQQNKRKADTM